MVRLKESQKPVSKNVCTISIPYGAIKRVVFLLFKIPFLISIPYGAIKSKLLTASQKMYTNFNSLWCD